jgi:hypothetical protein
MSIDLRTLPITTPSLFIPRVFPNIDEKRIRRIFDELNIGVIDRIDIVKVNSPSNVKVGDAFNRVYVHFKNWFSNSDANKTREALLSGKEIKIVYDEPWFWKVSAYREPVKVVKPVRQEKKKATIEFEEVPKPKSQAVKPAEPAVEQQQPHAKLPVRARAIKRLVPRQLSRNKKLTIEEEKPQSVSVAKHEEEGEEGEVLEN